MLTVLSSSQQLLFIDRVTNLRVSSFDVTQCSFGHFDQLCVSHSMDSGGSWLFGQSLNLEHR